MLSSWLAYLYAPILPYLKKFIKIEREGQVKPNPADILLPSGYTAEVVATGFNAPVHCTFDDSGACYVVESGRKIHVPPRILKVNTQTGETQVYYEFPESCWHKSGAVTGACWHDGALYVMNTDTLSRITPDGQIQDIVTGLPGLGDHQSNHPVVGPDSKIYFGQGCVTNCGIVGADDYAFEWLPKHPEVHDVPARDITLVGHNYPYQNLLGDLTETVETGAYMPFGVSTSPGHVVRGDTKCSGAILRCNPDGSNLEVVAWGLRNPYSVAFTADGRLFATEHGMDERGERYIVDDPDDLYEIHEGEWYGWPDYASGIRLDDPYWGKGGRGREPVIANPPNPTPPKPLATFQTHAAANGFSFSPNGDFGQHGDAFVACFGDLAPITTLKRSLTPAGFKVVRVNMKTGQVSDFAVNRLAGPASKLPHRGFERPSHVEFGPDGALYVVDYGEIAIALERGAIRMPTATGVLWRIRPNGEPKGEYPPPAVVLPVYGIRYLMWIGALLAALAAVWWLARRFILR
jgi:glucose/arabinose dehydrogenase